MNDLQIMLKLSWFPSSSLGSMFGDVLQSAISFPQGISSSILGPLADIA